MPQIRKPRPKCDFETCERPAEWGGLCPAHAMQRRRGLELRPIRDKSNPLVQIGNVSVPFAVAQALLERGPSLYHAAKQVLTEWAAASASAAASPDQNPQTAPARGDDSYGDRERTVQASGE